MMCQNFRIFFLQNFIPSRSFPLICTLSPSTVLPVAELSPTNIVARVTMATRIIINTISSSHILLDFYAEIALRLENDLELVFVKNNHVFVEEYMKKPKGNRTKYEMLVDETNFLDFMDGSVNNSHYVNVYWKHCFGLQGFVWREWGSAGDMMIDVSYTCIVFINISLSIRYIRGKLWGWSAAYGLEASDTIRLLIEHPDVDHPFFELILNIRALFRNFSFCTATYASRICNMCADALAKLGYNHQRQPSTLIESTLVLQWPIQGHGIS
ncbi:hypothetical protein LguiB_005978 [Lonicera macranthoides]